MFIKFILATAALAALVPNARADADVDWLIATPSTHSTIRIENGNNVAGLTNATLFHVGNGLIQRTLALDPATGAFGTIDLVRNATTLNGGERSVPVQILRSSGSANASTFHSNTASMYSMLMLAYCSVRCVDRRGVDVRGRAQRADRAGRAGLRRRELAAQAAPQQGHHRVDAGPRHRAQPLRRDGRRRRQGK